MYCEYFFNALIYLLEIRAHSALKLLKLTVLNNFFLLLMNGFYVFLGSCILVKTCENKAFLFMVWRDEW